MAGSDHRLSFERPIYELEARLEKLDTKTEPTPEVRNEIRRLRRELVETEEADLRQPQAVGDGRGRPAPRPAHDHRLPRIGLRGVRRAARRQVLRRRSGDPHRLGQARRLQGAGRRPSEGQDAQGTQPLQLRLRPSRGLPQGDGQDAAGGQVPHAGDLPDRHRRGLSGHRRRGARPGPGHRRARCSRCRGCRRPSSAWSSAKAARAGRWASASATAWPCSNTPTTRSSAPKAAPASSGRATPSRSRPPRP